ncbi:unnamed protein product [Effrenium voratum]|nr:unnamed protein product [Effrenium voratum]
MAKTLVLLPACETELQAKGARVGWAQDGLSAKGVEQAQKAGKLLTDAGFKFDALFTSVQKQAVCTAWTALMEGNEVAIPQYQSYRLNDRHWGSLQGCSEKDLEAKYSKEELGNWRVGAPPSVATSDAQHPCRDPKYRAIPASLLPGSESMATVVQRVQPLWDDAITPFLLSSKTPLVVAHEASIRALCQLLEEDTDQEALEYNILPGVPVIVELDEDLDFRKKTPLGLKAKAKAKPSARAAHDLKPGPKPKPQPKAPPAPKPKEEHDLEVKVVSAKGMRDADWWAGTSDPYVTCKVEGKGKGEFRTPTVSNHREESVKWNHLEKMKIKPGDSLVFTVYDEDTGKSDDFLGMVTLRFEELDFEGKMKLVDQKGKAMPGKTGKGAFLTISVKELD